MAKLWTALVFFFFIFDIFRHSLSSQLQVWRWYVDASDAQSFILFIGNEFNMCIWQMENFEWHKFLQKKNVIQEICV